MKTLFAALSLLLFLTLGACNSSKENVICDANGCRNANSVATAGTAGCFIASNGVCSSSVAGISCGVNAAGQCVAIGNQTTSGTCPMVDRFGNCISCPLVDHLGRCICRVTDVFGRCIAPKPTN